MFQQCNYIHYCVVALDIQNTQHKFLTLLVHTWIDTKRMQIFSMNAVHIPVRYIIVARGSLDNTENPKPSVFGLLLTLLFLWYAEHVSLPLLAV